MSTVLKLWQVVTGKARRYSKVLLTEEFLGTTLTGAALVGLWGFIHAQAYVAPALWQGVFWGLLALIVLQPALPKSRLLRSKGGTGVLLLNWLWALLWTVPLMWALWMYGNEMPQIWGYRR